MNKIITTLAFVLVAGCSGGESKWVVECDSGFSTGASIIAYIDEGSIRWKDSRRGWVTRKMIPGEACTTERITEDDLHE